jgi:hypothetical protein
MRPGVIAAIALLLGMGSASSAAAHGMRSVYVEIAETEAGRARVALTGKVPVTGVAITAAAPCAITTSPDTGTWLECPDRLGDAVLTITGMGPIASEAVIHVTLLDGSTASGCATPRSPSWTIPGAGAGTLAVARRYVVLGVEHIAIGVDHLLFLLALVLCLRSFAAVMLAETAFTLSHTLSFSASALGWLRVSPTAAEACIAASLVLIALEVARPQRDAAWKTAGGSLLPRSFRSLFRARVAGRRSTGPKIDPLSSVATLAFAFGLVHGLGFAGALAEVGLPPDAVPAALIGFAGGVELGQIAFLLIVMAVVRLLQRAPRVAPVAIQAGAYAVGGTGCFWLVERIAALG